MNNVKSAAKLEAFLQTASVDELRDALRDCAEASKIRIKPTLYLVEAAHCETATT